MSVRLGVEAVESGARPSRPFGMQQTLEGGVSRTEPWSPQARQTSDVLPAAQSTSLTLLPAYDRRPGSRADIAKARRILGFGESL